MILTSTYQLLESDIFGFPIDLFIGASGYEVRCRHAAERLHTSLVKNKFVFGFSDRITHDRKQNDLYFLQNKFEIINDIDQKQNELVDKIIELINSIDKDEISILIDYTSMTRVMYSAFLLAINKLDSKNKIRAVFNYSPAIYEEPISNSFNSTIGPLNGFCSLESPDKPTALIIGLGYEKDRSLGLFGFIDPAICYAIYTDPPLDERYLMDVQQNNSELLSSLPPDQIIAYPLIDLQWTANLLQSLYVGLRDEYRVIFAPLGVKPFALLCMLLAFRYKNEIDVWRVSGGTSVEPQKRFPKGPLLLYCAEFGNDK